MKKKIAFIGLGIMGYPMAGHLAKSGHQVTVFNRTFAKAERWCQEYKGEMARTPYEAAQDAEIVFLCVGNDQDVRQVLIQKDGVLSGKISVQCIVDHTTTSAELAKDMAQAAAQFHVEYLDAPVSGGEPGAQKGTLTVMVGGQYEAFKQLESIVAAYSKKCTWLGAVGTGQVCKMVNQILVAHNVQGLAEGIAFALKAGLDVPVLVDIMKQGAAQSWQLENRAVTMAEDKFDFGFPVEWMLKDLRIAKAHGIEMGLDLPLISQIIGFYEELLAAGHGRLDASALVKRLV